MPAWTLFSSVAILATAGFVLLARASARAVRAPEGGLGPVRDEGSRGGEDPGTDPDGPGATDRTSTTTPGSDDATAAEPDRPWAREGSGAAAGPDAPAASALASTPLLLANVLATHGVLAVVLLTAAWFAAVPPEALGLVVPGPATVALGVGLGLGLAVANEAAARVAQRVGADHDEWLREVLAPDTPGGWAGLLLLGLPVIAGAEELLFRGALVGALSVGLGWSVPLLVVLSSALFGLGHSLQGHGGVVVTALLGGALAAAFVLTGSLAVVVVAHYVVNAAEFLVHEGPLGRA